MSIFSKPKDRSVGVRDGGLFSAADAHTRYTADVSDDASRILEQALQLPESERAAVIAVLLDSLGDGTPSEEVEAAWIAEAKQRAEAIDRGELGLVDAEAMMTRLRQRAERAG